jgi:hypothetical protein
LDNCVTREGRGRPSWWVPKILKFNLKYIKL